jgi:hypothetical protein
MSEDTNPYRPPKAAVSDVGVEPLPVRPPIITVCLGLIAIQWLRDLHDVYSAFTIEPITAVFAGIDLAIVTVAGLFIARGANWARILFLVAGTIKIAFQGFQLYAPFVLPDGVRMQVDWMFFSWIVATLLVLVAAVVILVGPGRSWFRRRR